MSVRAALILLLALNLTGCGPIYSTRTELIPPSTAEGKLALNDCLHHKQECSNSCQNIQVQCEQNEAIRHVATEVVEALARKDGDDKKHRSRGSKCNQHMKNCGNGCENTYLACFQNVGGIVNTYRECVYNCHKA